MMIRFMRGGLEYVGASLLLLVGFLGTACTKDNPEFCRTDADCDKFPGRPFCDVNGEFAESDHTPHTCTTIPDGCPIERCGCMPGDGLSCDLDQLTVCNSDGRSTSTVTCALGCSTENRCLTFEPSNGLGQALVDAAAEPDVILSAGARIDTDVGVIQDAGGNTIAVRTELVAQGAGSIRVFLAHSFVLDTMTVQGSHSIAFVAPAPITLRGRLDASANAAVGGPGGQVAPSGCAGSGDTIGGSGTSQHSGGGGGGGNATMGGTGGSFGLPIPAGAALSGFEPLVGGCVGGSLSNADTTIHSLGGGGGGGIQLVSLDSIELTSSGLIDVGGGGGRASAGGGSGGNIVLEAPRVALQGSTTGFAANGGAGGGCGLNGADATADTNSAVAPKCADEAGDGATATQPPGAGEKIGCPSPCVLLGLRGGGGGSVGRARIATASGAVEMTGSPLASAQVLFEKLDRK
jgi:hypothetical protein